MGTRRFQDIHPRADLTLRISADVQEIDGRLWAPLDSLAVHELPAKHGDALTNPSAVFWNEVRSGDFSGAPGWRDSIGRTHYD